VTSLRALLGAAAPGVGQVQLRLARHFAAVCGRRLEWFPAGRPRPALLDALLAPADGGAAAGPALRAP